MTTSNDVILKRIEMIESELAELKRKVSAQGAPSANPPATLRGIWKGADITDEEISEVKRSWMKKFDDEPG